MSWTVFTRNQALRRTGQLEPTSIQVALRWCRPSTAILTLPTSAGTVRLGDGLILARNGVTVLSGVVADWRRAVTGDDDVLTVAVVDEIGRLSGRLIFPDPSEPADGTQPARDVRDGPAETVILQYVNVNAGPSAREERRIRGLTVAASQGRGSTVAGRARWANLAEYCAVLADRGDVGFRALQPLGGSSIVVDVVEPADRFEARFDLDGATGSGTVIGWVANRRLPETTVAVAGGRGDLADRLIRVRETDGTPFTWDGTAWTWAGRPWTWNTPQRRERWLDRSNAGDDGDLPSQQAELDAAGDDLLRSDGEQATLRVELADAPALSWQTHYELGDRVRVRLGGLWVWRQVREIDVEVDASGEQIRPTLGDAASGELLRLFDRIERVESESDLRGRQ